MQLKKLLGSKWQVQGPAYWAFESEILDERRDWLEEEESCEIEAAGDQWIQSQIDPERGK